MDYMIANETNYRTAEQIIEVLHKNGITVSQSRAILDFVEHKIAQDTKVGELIRLDRAGL
jgi:arginine repressor